MPPPPLLQRLKERKLVQWAVAYLAGAFVVLQLLDALEGALGLTSTVQRAILVMVAIGFFITLVLAWYHGEKGNQRVSGPELLMVSALLVVAGAAVSKVVPREETPGQRQNTRVPAASRDKPSIAVLPCDNIGPEPDSVFYAKGIHETILLQLQRISALTTISRTSVLQYQEDPPPITEIGSDLGVAFVGECSVQKDAHRIRVIFQLINAENDEHLWAEEYDRDLTTQGLLEINSDIASRVAGSLQARILPEERDRIDRLPTPSVNAHDDYFLGRHYLEDVAYVSEAVRFFELAIEEDPSFALAHSGLALAYDIMASTGGHGITPREGWARAGQEARRALELDNTLAEPYTVLADARMIEWDWLEAENAFRRAIELQPSYATAHQWYSILLIAQGRIEEALLEGQIAVDVNPRVGGSIRGQAIRLLNARRYDEAVSLFEEALTLPESRGLSAWWASWAFAVSGMGGRALQALRDGLAGGLDSISAQGLTAGVHALAGEVNEAREILQDLEALHEEAVSGGGYLDPSAFWPAYALIGELDSAFTWLEEGVEAGSWLTLYLGVAPFADPLRDDPRYQALLDRIGLGHLKGRFDSIAAADPRGGA